MNTPNQIPGSLYPEPNEDDLSSYFHRQLIGATGFILPLLLWLIAGWRPMQGIPPWQPLGSISAYYYSGAVSAFAGCLVAMALFLFSYRGYDNDYGHRDRVAAIIAGCAAVLVALFPTGSPSPLPAPSWWTPLMGQIHHISAAVLFCSFIFFSLFQFPRSQLNKADLPLDKRVRNWIYISCGVAIILCMVWVVSASSLGTSIFWPESLALEFFAISWLVKGRADKTAAAAGSRVLYYARHPRHLVKKAWNVVRGKREAGPTISHNGN